MRAVLCFSVLFGVILTACNQGDVTTNAVRSAEQGNDCENVWSRIEPSLIPKKTALMEITAKLACYYGARNASAIINCSIPIDDTPLLSDSDRGGLNDRSAAFLLASTSLGSHMQYRRHIEMASAGYTEKDDNKCLQAMHDIPNDRKLIRDNFPLLRKDGY